MLNEITETELLSTLSQVLDSLADTRVAYRVSLNNEIFTGDREFYLYAFNDTPTFEEVYDDPEYGWPSLVNAQDIHTIEDLIPMPRKHPIILVNDQPRAISIQTKEYQDIEAYIEKMQRFLEK